MKNMAEMISAVPFDLLPKPGTRVGPATPKAVKGDKGSPKNDMPAPMPRRSSFFDLFATGKGEHASVGRGFAALRSGWLKKKAAGFLGIWEWRWCIITSDGRFAYYTSASSTANGSIIELHSATVRIKDRNNFLFNIETGKVLDKTVKEGLRPKEGVIELYAPSLAEMLKWSAVLRTQCKAAGDAGAHTADSLSFLNRRVRQFWTRMGNKEGRTALHLAANEAVSKGQLPSSRLIQTAMWLVDNGCRIDLQDDGGNTALHLACKSGQIELAAALLRKGADPEIENKAGAKALALVSSGEADVEALHHILTTDVPKRNPLLSHPKHGSNSKYVGIFIERLSLPHTPGEALKETFLTITVYNEKQQLVEDPQDIMFPTLSRPDYTWFGWTWYMQTPLEIISEKSYAIVEVKTRPMTAKAPGHHPAEVSPRSRRVRRWRQDARQ